MNAITLNITFNSIDDLNAFMAGRQQPQAAPVDTRTPDQVRSDDSSLGRYYDFKLPGVGADVHWDGPCFTFDGVVDRIDDDTDDMSDKCVWVRRNDTGKLVSLTGHDLNTHGSLTAL